MKETFPVIVITGLSGSGKSTALRVFEDMGYFTVDGIPTTFALPMTQLFAQSAFSFYKGIALGMDIRQQDFTTACAALLHQLEENNFLPQLIFLESHANILLQRYATTRRPHPLEKEGVGLLQALRMERERLASLRECADLVIDSSFYSIHDLRRVLQEKWHVFEENQRALRVHLIAFGFKYGMPAEADMVFDVRFLPNPFFEAQLKEFSGKEQVIQDYVFSQPEGKDFLTRLTEFIFFTLEQNEKEGRFRTTIAIGCTGGKHRSVATVDLLTLHLRTAGYVVTQEYRHLELG